MNSKLEAARAESNSDAPDESTKGAWRLEFVIIAAITGICMTAASLSRPMVTYRAIEVGATPLEIGLVQSAFSLLPLFTALPLGRAVDRIGEVRILAAGSAALTLGGLAAAASAALVGLAVGQLLMGFGMTTVAVAGQAMVANRGPSDRRVERFAWYSVVVSIGQIAGPALVALLATRILSADSGPPNTNGETQAFVVAALASGVACVLSVVLMRLSHPQIPREVTERHFMPAALHILRRPSMKQAMFVSLAVTSALDVILAYLPAWGAANGVGIATVGALLSVRAAASLISRIFMGRLIQRIGLGATLTVATGTAAIAVAVLPLTTSQPVLVLVMVLTGLGLGIGQPLTIAWVANRSPIHERGLALGLRVTGNLVALLVVPTAMGVVAGAAGIDVIWVVLAVILGVATVVAAKTPLDRDQTAGTGGVQQRVPAIAGPAP